MIVKKIGAWPKGKGRGSLRAAHAAQLLDYMNSPQEPSAMQAYLIDYFIRAKMPDFDGERLIQMGSNNFVTDSFVGMRGEMMAIAQSAVRSPNPLDHWLLSWREGEFPTNVQVDEAVAIFTKHMRLEMHQCIYAVHGDTHNRHVHIALNRYDPVRQRMVSAGGGFAIEEAHKAVAKITDHFGWAAEHGALYVMRDGQPVLAANIEVDKAQRQRRLSSEANAYETRTGYRSLQRLAQEQALPLIRTAQSWADMHARLAAVGMEYVRTRTSNGAALLIRNDGVQASKVSRAATIVALERRFGQPFEARFPDVAVSARAHEDDVLPDAFRAREYREIRADRAAEGIGPEALTRRREQIAEVDAVTASIAADPVKSVDDVVLLSALQSLRRERTRPAKRRVPAIDLEQWLHYEGETWYAERWRNRRQPQPEEWIVSGSFRTGKRYRIIGGYIGYPCVEGRRYARPGEGTAFIDRGDRITVTPGQNDDAVEAALRLAAAAFDGSLVVSGSPAFRVQVYRLCDGLGLTDRIAGDEFAAWQEAHAPTNANPTVDKSSAYQILSNNPPARESPPRRGPGQASPLSSAAQKWKPQKETTAGATVSPALAGAAVDKSSQQVADLRDRAFVCLEQSGVKVTITESGRYKFDLEALSADEAAAVLHVDYLLDTKVRIGRLYDKQVVSSADAAISSSKVLPSEISANAGLYPALLKAAEDALRSKKVR